MLEGVCIPRKSYSDAEIELGKKACVGIDEVMYAKLGANALFQEMVARGEVLVKDKEPEGQETVPEMRIKLDSQRDTSAKEIAALKDRIAELEASRTESNQGAIEAAVAKAVAAVEAEARDIIAEKAKEIERLKELLDEGED